MKTFLILLTTFFFLSFTEKPDTAAQKAEKNYTAFTVRLQKPSI